MIHPDEQLAWAQRLSAMGMGVRAALMRARESGQDLSAAVACEGGDTIFAIDRHVEPIIEEHIAQWPATCFGLVVVAEGMGADGIMRFECDKVAPRFRVLIDPIDGTRSIMYDKRSAWFIACVAEDRGDSTNVADSFASCMVELPTSKQGWADHFSATIGAPTTGTRTDLRTREERAISFGPSTASTLRNGFAQVANFFPMTKVLASELMERIAAASLGEAELTRAAIFDDQYISTAGQMVELMVGHDRFCCDLRPLFYRMLAQQRGADVASFMACHPYDVAGLLAAQRAGVIMTDGFGRPLRTPMTVHDGVHWCGYANKDIRRHVEPIIQAFLAEHGITSSEGR